MLGFTLLKGTEIDKKIMIFLHLFLCLYEPPPASDFGAFWGPFGAPIFDDFRIKTVLDMIQKWDRIENIKNDPFGGQILRPPGDGPVIKIQTRPGFPSDTSLPGFASSLGKLSATSLKGLVASRHLSSNETGSARTYCSGSFTTFCFALVLLCFCFALLCLALQFLCCCRRRIGFVPEYNF